MPRECQITGARTQTGNKKSRRGLAKRTGGIGIKLTGITKRKFKVNLQSKHIWVPEMNQFVRIRVSSRGLRTITKKGAYRALLDAGIIKPAKPRKKVIS